MSEHLLSSFGRTCRKDSPLSHLTQNTLVCFSAGEWGAPGNSRQVSRRALKWARFLRPRRWLHQDCPAVTWDALPLNHQKWPRGTSHHTMSDSNTTSPCHCSQIARNSQSEALQMPSEHLQKAAPLCWPGRSGWPQDRALASADGLSTFSRGGKSLTHTCTHTHVQSAF